MAWGQGLESWLGIMAWNHGLELWVDTNTRMAYG